MKIYKKDSKGKIRSLEIWAEAGILYQESGLLDGKKIKHSKACIGKNIGRANETTIQGQAIAEKVALIKKKLRESYFYTQKEAETLDVVLPMLAKDYFKEYRKLQGKSIGLQAKLDGIRCKVTIDIKNDTITAISRKNKPITNVNHILDELREYAKNYYQVYDTLILDGELYVHGKTFQEVTKLVKNKPENEFVEYHVYDIIDNTKTFRERDAALYNFIFASKLKYVVGVNTTIEPIIPLEKEYENYISQGYEGMMVRVMDSMYKVNGRSSDLLKYKKFIDVALPIVDITPGKSRPEHGTVWIEYNGILQKVGNKISHADRQELLDNKHDYIGKIAEIRYFEHTDEGKLRFANYHGIRIDK